MAESFLDLEASESEGSEDEEIRQEIIKKKKNLKHLQDSDDDDDEEEDDEAIAEQMKDFIDNDNIEEDGDSEDDEEKGTKRSHDDEELNEDLDDEDYDLIRDNLGINIARKKKLRRVRQLDTDDEEEENEESRDVNEREAIAGELFGDDDDDANAQSAQHINDRSDRQAIDDRYAELSGSEGSDGSDSERDFIVDDDDRPIAPRVRKKKSHRLTDDALQQAQDIFGVDFDFDDFQQQFDDGEYEGEGEEEDEYEEAGLDDTQRTERRKSGKKRSARKSIFEIYEPSELERSHLTQTDNDIRNTDIPERFQLRSVPVTSCEERELEEEADWIYTNAFDTKTITIQDVEHGEATHRPIYGDKKREAIPKIQEALRFMRNEHFEVPFIAYYRKEYIEPDLNINDLWVIYKWDEKWCQLQNRKKNLIKLLTSMQQYQTEYYFSNTDAIPEGLRLINDVDIERIASLTSFEELRDCWTHFQLYYSTDVQAMKKEQIRKDRERRLDQIAEEDPDKILNEDEEQINARLSSIKIAPRKDTYAVCKEAGIMGFASKFGLTPEQFGENLRDNYSRHEVEQCPTEPYELAQAYFCNRFPNTQSVLEAAKFIVAKQISSDPLVRKCVRQTFFDRAKVHAKPNKKGIKEIDENHPCYTYKYLRNKPVIDFVGDQFVQLQIAKNEGLIDLDITIDKLEFPDKIQNETHTYFDEIKQLYHRDEFSTNVQEWNKLREEAVQLALDKFLYPHFKKELTIKVLNEAHEAIIKQCAKKLYNWLKIAPYQIMDAPFIEEDDDFDTRNGIRIMGFSFAPSNDEASFAVVIDGDGEVTDYVKLEYFMLKRTEFSTDQEKVLREKDKEKLRRFIYQTKPHVIAVGADTIITRHVMEDLKNIVNDLIQVDSFPNISVELLDNNLASVYMNSKRALADFGNYPPRLRQAISLARRLQDPLIEFSQLCTADEEILCLKFHSLQDHLPKDSLLSSVYLEFVNRVNEVGIDINRAIVHPHTAQLVQFIGGLGPRKGAYLIRCLKKQQTPLLENRTQLVQNCNIGKVVFINCAGFIKIDTASLSDTGTDTYIEVLDSTRVHPEAYEWARKMAVDALEYDEDNENNHPAQALEEIIENPEKLKDLDLDAFAEELTRQGMGLKNITLYDIRAELTNRYKDLRTMYTPANVEEVFQLLTGETHQTFYIGKLVLGQVTGIYRRRPQTEQLDNANPIRNEETSLWKCPFCFKDDFQELSDVWNHFDQGSCPGQATGVKVRLDNGVFGMVQNKNLSDKEVIDPSERVHVGMTVHCRIVNINIEKFSVDLTCRTSDLLDLNHQWRPHKDRYYCYEAEDIDVKAEEDAKKKKNRQTYIKRIIVHPSFHNIDYKKAEQMLAEADQGEVVIRPSSKANDHLTLTWKVHDGINAHVDIKEEGKDNAFSLGHQLFINNEAYEDLDEIIARYVQPMASYARDLINFKYYKETGGKRDEMEKICREEKQKAPSRIPYFVATSKEFPGKFLLSYQPNQKVFHEFITLTPDGFRYRNNIFRSVNALFKWFKNHFNDRSTFPRTPVATPVMRTPLGQSSYIGAGATPNIDPQAIQRAAASMPNALFNTLSQVAQTPSFGGAVAAFGNQGSMPPPFPPSGRNYYNQGTPAPPTPLQMMGTPHLTTPRNYQNTTPRSMQPPQMSSQRPGSRSGSDWSSMAETWGSKKPIKQRTPLYNTPGASSQMSISPNANTPNQGDHTPLVDEWN